MKRAILTAITVVVVSTAAVAGASERQLNVLLTGGAEANVLDVKLSPDGRSYVISSIAPLEIGTEVCEHPEVDPNKLVCEAAAIAGFEVNAGGGNDSVTISPKVPVPVTLRAGPGDDRLLGGAVADKIVGGNGNDTLIGRGGGDWLFGGPGDDWIFGGPGDDRLLAEAGDDVLHGGPGKDTEVGGPGHDTPSVPPRNRAR